MTEQESFRPVMDSMALPSAQSLLPQPEAEEKSDASAETEKDDIIPSK